jgi:hypothetical protein
MPDVVPGAPEVIHASDHTRLTRVSLDGRTTVCKEPLGPNAEARLRHEVAILERLRGLPGIVQLVPEPAHTDSIVLEDAGARARPSCRILSPSRI